LKISLDAKFNVYGIVGKIIQTPHDQYSGTVVVVEIHAPKKKPSKQSQNQKASLLDPWYILFKSKDQVQGLKTGLRVCASGRLERSFVSDPSWGVNDRPYLKPMCHFFWGEQWNLISESDA